MRFLQSLLALVLILGCLAPAVFAFREENFTPSLKDGHSRTSIIVVSVVAGLAAAFLVTRAKEDYLRGEFQRVLDTPGTEENKAVAALCLRYPAALYLFFMLFAAFCIGAAVMGGTGLYERRHFVSQGNVTCEVLTAKRQGEQQRVSLRCPGADETVDLLVDRATQVSTPMEFAMERGRLGSTFIHKR